MGAPPASYYSHPKLDHLSIETYGFEGMPDLEKYLDEEAKPSITRYYWIEYNRMRIWMSNIIT